MLVVYKTTHNRFAVRELEWAGIFVENGILDEDRCCSKAYFENEDDAYEYITLKSKSVNGKLVEPLDIDKIAEEVEFDPETLNDKLMSDINRLLKMKKIKPKEISQVGGISVSTAYTAFNCSSSFTIKTVAKLLEHMGYYLTYKIIPKKDKKDLTKV